MSKLVSIIIFVFAIANVGFSQINFEAISLADAMKKAEKEEKKIFIDVYTTWCGPCKAMDANVFSDKKVGERMTKEYVALKIDYEKGEFKNDVIKYQIKGYPTMLILDANGIEIGRIYGSTTLDGFHKELDNYSTKKFSAVTQAFKNLENKSTGQKVWKESLVLLNDNINSFANSDLYNVYLAACKKYYENFDITTYDADGDLKIFRNVTLPVEHPVVQLYLNDSSDYGSYLHKDYMVLTLAEEVKKAKTDSERAEIKERAEKYHAYHFKKLFGDADPLEYFMKQIFPEKAEEKVIEEKTVPAEEKKKKRKSK